MSGFDEFLCFLAILLIVGTGVHMFFTCTLAFSIHLLAWCVVIIFCIEDYWRHKW